MNMQDLVTRFTDGGASVILRTGFKMGFNGVTDMTDAQLIQRTQEIEGTTMRKLRKGSKFRLTEDAIENYGEQYRGETFTVLQWFDHYCPAKEMHLPENLHGHPGYEDDGSERILYDAKELNFSVYDWEIERV